MRDNSGKKSESCKFFFFRSESASSTVIGTVLLLGIIFSVFSIVWIGYIPEWKNDAESSHMEDIYKDMADLKSKTDMMSIVLASKANSVYINSSEPSSSSPQLVISVPFHMGGGDIPIIGPIKSSGSLAVNKDRCIMSVSVYPNTTNIASYFKSINCGTVTYNSQNRYYVDQIFSYEGGALVLEQDNQSVMTLYPSIRFSKTATNQYNVSINTVRIFQKPYAPPEIISSNTDCFLRLAGLDYRLLHDSKGTNLNRFVLTVYTKHPEAWKRYLEKAIDEADISSGEYILESGESNSVRLTFPSNSKGINRLYLSETVVKAEPGIGLN